MHADLPADVRAMLDAIVTGPPPRQTCIWCGDDDVPAHPSGVGPACGAYHCANGMAPGGRTADEVAS